jgi:hypothetical protein
MTQSRVFIRIVVAVAIAAVMAGARSAMHAAPGAGFPVLHDLKHGEGDAVTIAVAATGFPDVTYSATGLPPGITITTGRDSNNRVVGLLSGILTQGLAGTDPVTTGSGYVGAEGLHAVTIFASDGSSSNTFTWDVGRWGSGDVFVGIGNWTYQAYDQNGNYKTSVVIPDDQSKTRGYTTGCAADWHTGELWATNLDPAFPAVNVITRHAAGPGAPYTDVTRRVDTARYKAGFTFPVDSAPYSVGFDSTGNMFVSDFGGFRTNDDIEADTEGRPIYAYVDENLQPSNPDDYHLLLLIDATGALIYADGDSVNPLEYDTWQSPDGYYQTFDETGVFPRYLLSGGQKIPVHEQGGQDLQIFQLVANGYSAANRSFFNTATSGRSGTDQFDLLSDQHTVVYTSESPYVYRYDTATSTQMPVLGSNDVNAPRGISNRRTYGLRVLPPGDGSGGYLVANYTAVDRLDSAGRIVQGYAVKDDPDYAGDVDGWYLVSVAPDGRSFWATTYSNSDLYRIDIASGKRVGNKIHVANAANGVTVNAQSLCVNNEYVAAQENCGANGLGDGTDDDQDGVIDDGCFRIEVCSISSPGDDDGDGLADINDPDCGAPANQLCAAEGPTSNGVAGFCDRASNEGDTVEVLSTPLPCEGSVCDSWTFEYTATGLPGGLSIDPHTGTISGTPFYSLVDNSATAAPVTFAVHVHGSWSIGDSEVVTLNEDFDWAISNTNRAPMALNDSATVTTGGSVVIDAQLNDSDVDGDSISFATGSITQPTSGQVTVVGQQLQYTAAPGFSGVVTFTYRVQDNYAPAAPSNVATVTVIVNGPPVAHDDAYDMASGTTLTVPANTGLIANSTGRDTDPESDGLTVLAGSTTVPTSGSVSVNPDGSFEYISAPGFSGTATFSYRVTDGTQSSNLATVSITVHLAPVAVNDSYSTFLGLPIIKNHGGFMMNDSDPEGGTLHLVWDSITGPLHGTLVPSEFGDGDFVYTPNALYVGSDSFTYRVTNGRFESNAATVTIDIRPSNKPPVAQDDYFTVDQGVTLSVPAGVLLSNDTDPEGEPLAPRRLTFPDPDPGTFSFSDLTGAFQYTSSPGFSGYTTFTYSATDPWGGTSTATVHIRVNARPVAVNNTYTTNEDTTLAVTAASGLLANDTDLDLDALHMLTSGVISTSHGTVTIGAAGDGTFTYVPNANFNGTDSFTYQVTDGRLTSNAATVTIVVASVNDVPAPVDDAFTTNEDTTLTASVAGNDTLSADGNGTNTFALATGTAHGTVMVNANGSFTDVPAANYNGTDSFIYTLCDVDHDCTPATATITIVTVNDLPAPAADTFTGVEDMILAGTVASNDTRSGDGGDTWTLFVGAAHGVVTMNADGTFTYLPAANFNGVDNFSYKQCDATPDCVTATVSLSIGAVDDQPLAVDDLVTTLEDTPAAGSVTGNDAASGDGNNQWSVVTTVTHGTLTFTSAGAFTYTPAANYNGTDSFSYQVCDVDGDCDSAVVTITVTPTNDVPVAMADAFSTNAGVAYSGNVTGNDTPSADGSNTWTLVTSVAHGTLTFTDGAFTYTPATGYNGPDSFTYRLCDATPDCSTATVSITVTAVVTGALAKGDTATIGFWHNKNGQALIKSVNGGSAATNLGNWLALNYPSLFGALAGTANNLTGKTNLQVAAYDLTLFSSNKKMNQVLAGALAAYVTNSTLAGGTYAAGYGFKVTTSGTGSKTYNVGSHGTAIGLTNNTSYTVSALLTQANLRKALNLYNETAFNVIFDGINNKGDIK